MIEHSETDLWMWKCFKLHLYIPAPKQNLQWGLSKLLLTFLDDAIDKNSLAIWSERASLSRVLAHLKWIFHFHPRCTGQQQAGIYWCLSYSLCLWAGTSEFPWCFTRELIVSQTEFWGFSWFTIKHITFFASYFSHWMVSKRNRISSTAWDVIIKI